MYIPIEGLIFLILVLLSPLFVMILLRIFREQEEHRQRIKAEKAPDITLYYTIFGEHYHSSENCPALKNIQVVISTTKYEDPQEIGKRAACLRCCRWQDGKVYPRSQFK